MASKMRGKDFDPSGKSKGTLASERARSEFYGAFQGNKFIPGSGGGGDGRAGLIEQLIARLGPDAARQLLRSTAFANLEGNFPMQNPYASSYYRSMLGNTGSPRMSSQQQAEALQVEALREQLAQTKKAGKTQRGGGIPGGSREDRYAGKQMYMAEQERQQDRAYSLAERKRAMASAKEADRLARERFELEERLAQEQMKLQNQQLRQMEQQMRYERQMEQEREARKERSRQMLEDFLSGYFS